MEATGHTPELEGRAARRFLLCTLIVLAGLILTKALDRPDPPSRLVMPATYKAKADICAIADAVNAFAIRNQGRFPESLEVLVLPDEDGQTFLDCQGVPRDPWDRPYGYEPPAAGTSRFRVFSLGADGLPGGDGDDRDIDNLPIKEGKI